MAYKDTILADSPVIYLEFDETSGNPVNDGSHTISSYSVTAGVDRTETGMVGNAWRLPAKSDNVVITHGSGNAGAYTDNVFSVEVWVNPAASTGNDYLAVLGNTSSGNHAYIYKSTTGTGGRAVGYIKGSVATGQGVTGTTNIADGNWHHIVFTVNGSAKKLYVDGVLQASNNTSHGTFAPTTHAWMIGGASTTSAVGSYDEFAVYDTELTSTQVTAHYNAATAPAGDAGYNAQAVTATAAMPGGNGFGNNQRLAVTEDAVTYSSLPTTNSGADESVAANNTNVAFFKFAALSGTDVETSRTLYLDTIFAVNQSYTFNVYRVDATWSESTITHSNKPATTLIRTVTVPTGDANGLYAINITGADAGNGVAISTTTSTNFSFATSENATIANRPYAMAATAPQAAQVVNADPITASGLMPDPVVSTARTVSASGQPMTATAAFVDAAFSTTVMIDVTVNAEPVYAFGDMPDGKFAMPVTVAAEAMTASAEIVEPTFGTTKGAVILAGPMTAAAVWKQPEAVNDMPIIASEAEDDYFQKVIADAPGTWFRLNTKGSTETPRVGSLELLFSGVQTGQYNAPENRHSVYLNGSAYMEQVEPSATNVDEALNYGTGSPASTLEFSIRTTKKDQFIMVGKDNAAGALNTSPMPARELYLRNGRIHSRTHYFTNSAPFEFTGFKDIADGQWHHIVIRTSAVDQFANTGGQEVFIDGKLDIRRGQGGIWYGFPDFIGSRPTVVDEQNLGALPSSQNFVGDMSEVVFYGRSLSIHNLTRHYYAFMGWKPIEPEPMTATAALMTGSRAKGNQKKALYLWWTAGVDAYNIGGDGFNGKMNFDPILDGHGNFGSYDVAGYKVFSRSVVAKSDGSPYRDVVTDRQSLINLETDIDINDYEVIMFGDWPDEGPEIDLYDREFPGERERLVNQLRWANDKGVGLFVTHPRLAVDLGIVDRVDYVPTLKEQATNTGQGNAFGLYDYGSAVKFPWNITASSGLETADSVGSNYNGQAMNTNPDFLRAKAFFYGDTNKNDRFRVRALIEGLTDVPSYMIKDAIYHKDFDSWGWQSVAYKYLHRENGLQIGDEFIFHGSDMGYDFDAVSSDFTDVRVGRWFGFYATPLNNVKAGTVVTTLGAKHWKGTAEVDNPYRNYATTIVLRPGDSLAGKPVGGKIYVNFTEQANRAPESVAVQVLPPTNAGFPANYNPDTPAQREWEWSDTRKSLRTSGNPTVNAVNVTLPNGQVIQVSTTGGGEKMNMTRSRNIFPIEYHLSWSMNRRGLFWLMDKPEVEEGAVNIRAEAMTATVSTPKPAVVAQRDADTRATPMVALTQMPKVDEDISGEVEIVTLPMTANATFTGFSRVIHAEPMEATAEFVENLEMVHTTGEQIVLILHGVDATLFIKEEA